jgi:hypothetical protein
VGTVGSRRVVDDLDHEERLIAPHAPSRQRATGRIIIEAVAARVPPIGGGPVRLVGSIDHDPAQIRAPHAVDRVERDAVRLFDDVSVDRGPVPRRELVASLNSTPADLAEARTEAAPARDPRRLSMSMIASTIHIRVAAPEASAGMR